MLTQGSQILRDTARAAFWQGWDSFPSITDGITFVQGSDADQETYAWLAYAPAVREMVGGKVIQTVPEITFTVKNKMWEVTVGVPYMTWKFNKNGAIAQLAMECGKKARQHRDKLISANLIDVGDATACYDGQFFFDTDHSDPGAAYTTAQSNDLTYTAASGTTPTDIEMAGAVATAIGTLMSYKDGAGDPVTYGAVTPGKIAIHSSVGTSGDQYSILLKLASAEYLTSGASNPVRNLFTPVFNPFLTAGPELFTFNTGSTRKPFILQIAEEVKTEDDFGSQHEFNTKDRQFGSFGVYNAAYGDWRMGVLTTFT